MFLERTGDCVLNPSCSYITYPRCPRDLEFVCRGKELQTLPVRLLDTPMNNLADRQLWRHQVHRRKPDCYNAPRDRHRWQDDREVLTQSRRRRKRACSWRRRRTLWQLMDKIRAWLSIHNFTWFGISATMFQRQQNRATLGIGLMSTY